MRLQARQNNATCSLNPSSCPKLSCNCPQGNTCSFTSFTCDKCPVVVCTPTVGQSNSGGISTGVLAGSVVAVFAFAIIATAAFFWWRRRRAALAPVEEKLPPPPRDVPANPEAVLSRPDPIEKSITTPTRSHFSGSGPAGDGASQRSVDAESFLTHDPFADQATIQTASARTHSQNVITIGLMPPPDGITSLGLPPTPGPQRPVRSPDLSLRGPGDGSVNLHHVNVSDDSLRPPNARFAKAKSVRSVRTTASGMSAFSTASSVVDILQETPQIVSPVHGAVRQVVGVVKAEVVQVPVSPPSGGGLQPPLSRAPSRPAGRSPLAQSSFTPDDLHDNDSNPFGDGSADAVDSSASIKTTSTFGQQQLPSDESTPTQWTFPPTPTWPVDSRPVSIQSNVGTIIADIGSATRVVFGMQSPQYSSPNLSTARESTSTLSPPLTRRGPPPHVYPADDEARRMSHNSVASSRADSILEAFPFVPPSPIAARPPRSPMGMTFTPPSPGARSTSSLAHQQDGAPPAAPSAAPMERSTRVASTMSNSSGLTAFPFKFPDEEAPPVPGQGRRASLDTLALSRDLEAFPLPFDDPLRSSVVSSAQ